MKLNHRVYGAYNDKDELCLAFDMDPKENELPFFWCIFVDRDKLYDSVGTASWEIDRTSFMPEERKIILNGLERNENIEIKMINGKMLTMHPVEEEALAVLLLIGGGRTP